MKNSLNIKQGLRQARSLNVALKSLFIGILLAVGGQSTILAQETVFTNPSWWFGVAAGANVNFYQGTTQQLTTNFMAPAAFHDGMGIGIFVAPLIEYHRPDTKLGFMFQLGYDKRRGEFDQVMAPCNCPADLNTNLDYLSFEPSLRFAPFKSSLYLFVGPRFAINLNKNFIYQKSVNPDFPDGGVEPEMKGEFSEVNKIILSAQIGAGYDIELTSANKQLKTVLSPFVSYHPYFGQDPRSIESWNITTVRAGIALKFGRGPAVPQPEKLTDIIPLAPVVRFAVVSPGNIPEERRVRETFPLLNYVFFNQESTEIPARYVKLDKNQVADFKEDQLEEFAPLKLSGRSNRQMIAYYNVLNILGIRMGEYPSSTITLIGTSEEDSQDGKLMAESVKRYLVDIFGIDASRINVEVRNKPKLPSEQPGGTRELTLLREEDRRVTIESSSPALLMEFRSGSAALLRPVELIAIQEAPLDSYVIFNVVEGNDAFSSWSLEVKDEDGQTKNFGPYSQEKISMPGKLILSDKTEGDYKVVLVGQTHSGMKIKRDTTVHMKLWTPLQDEEGLRFSVIYNDSTATAMYEKYLTEIVTPKIPIKGSVRIHGYTDIIGDDANNRSLSLARAKDVKKIIESSLLKSGRNDVSFQVFGFGENQKLSQFDNKYPEERFYNRTVIIDVLPK